MAGHQKTEVSLVSLAVLAEAMAGLIRCRGLNDRGLRWFRTKLASPQFDDVGVDRDKVAYMLADLMAAWRQIAEADFPGTIASEVEADTTPGE